MGDVHMHCMSVLLSANLGSLFQAVLVSIKFDLCLLLYVIRLVGWLKNCDLSFSLQARL